MKIFFAVMAGMLMCLMASAKDDTSRKHFTYGFLGAIAGTLALYAIG